MGFYRIIRKNTKYSLMELQNSTKNQNNMKLTEVMQIGAHQDATKQ